MWLDKALFQNTRSTANILSNTAETWKKAPLLYLPIILREMSRKMSLILISEISGLFVNTLTADDKYSFRDNESLRQPTLIYTL